MKENLLKSFSLPSPQKCADHTMDPNKLNCFRGKCSYNSLTRSMLVGGPSPRLAMWPRQKVRSFVNLSTHFVWSCFSFGYDCLMLWFGEKNITVTVYISIKTYACVDESTYLSVCLSVYLPIYVSMHLCIYASMDLWIYASMHLSIYLSIYLSLYLSIYLSISLSIYLI